MLPAWGRKELAGETQFPGGNSPFPLGNTMFLASDYISQAMEAPKMSDVSYTENLVGLKFEKMGILLLASKLCLCKMTSSWVCNAQALEATNYNY